MKITFASLVGIGIFLLLAGLFTQTSLFRNWLKVYAVEQINELLNGDISIGEIDGSLFTDIKIRNLLISQDDDTLLQVGDITIAYDPFALLRDTIKVHVLSISNLAAGLSQDTAGIWNVSQLMKKDTLPKTSIEKIEESFPYTILLESFRLYGTRVKIQTQNEIIPKHLSELFVGAHGFYNSGRFEISLDSLAFQSTRPDLNRDSRIHGMVIK